MSEREQFEAWAKVRYAKNPHFWLRQIDDGGYSCGMADAAWAAWQVARAQPAITPETGNAPPQGASAITSETVPLSDDELLAMWSGGDERFMRPVLGSKKVIAYARAVEQAVRAKQAEVVPPGFVLVPVEPTPEMLEVGKEAHYEAEVRIQEPGAYEPRGFGSRKVRVAHVYRAMLAAAQGAKA